MPTTSCYDYNIPDDAKAFTVAESMIAFYNLFKGIWFFYIQISFFQGKSTHPVFYDVLLIFFAILLLVQGTIGLFLYSQGFQKRNKTICHMWIFAAFGNIILLLILNALNLVYNVLDIWPDLVSMIYLLYTILGMKLLLRFLRYLKKGGNDDRRTESGTEGTPSRSQSYEPSRHHIGLERLRHEHGHEQGDADRVRRATIDLPQEGHVG